VIAPRVMTAHPGGVEDRPMSEVTVAVAAPGLEAPFEPEVGEQRLLARLRAGDERAFAELVDSVGPLMLRIALAHVRTRAVAEEVVQEAWLGVLAGLDAFEGRSSLKTWILRILVNRAKTRGVREARSIPFTCLGDEGDGEPAVDPDRFLGPDHPRWPGGWSSPPASWGGLPEDRLMARETLAVVTAAIESLPARQQEVIVMRDVQGWEPEDVCAALDISEGNQRVLLHRARARVRAALERHLAPAHA
jgi:RNA polymerase sigma-70 factor (ECF subfamily)